MTVDRIDPVLVEKAAKAIHYCAARHREDATAEMMAEAVIDVVFDELGLEEEHAKGTEGGPPYHYVRPVGKWRPVEQGDAQ